jgi:hypothetical protein
MSPPFGFFFRLAAGGQDAVIHFPSFFVGPAMGNTPVSCCARMTGSHYSRAVISSIFVSFYSFLFGLASIFFPAAPAGRLLCLFGFPQSKSDHFLLNFSAILFEGSGKSITCHRVLPSFRAFNSFVCETVNPATARSTFLAKRFQRNVATLNATRNWLQLNEAFNVDMADIR